MSAGSRLGRIGPYHLVETIGEGAMGVVYLAEQHEPIRRRVALKVIKLGMDTLDVVARFDTERQALALMDHPGVARMFDAGATADGRPYFVMEHVSGEPITTFCDRHRLSIRDRIALIIEVCDAVEHAHARGIVHRDLKPSNVLVALQNERAAPKVIDFGVAKATRQGISDRTMFTEKGLILGTLEYMSPEQSGMTGVEADARTDVYALGVMLYELMTGVLPFDATRLRAAGYAEIQRIIQEEEPVRPSERVRQLAPASDIAAHRHTEAAALEKALRGDLDWITTRALEKDRARRYPSAADLAADLGRHLRDDPVIARPPSVAYKTGRFVRKRRRVLVAVATMTLALSAALWLGLLLLNRSRAETERARLEAILRRLEENPVAARAGPTGLDADERALRQGFLSGVLPPAGAERFARLLINPQIRVSNYVTRSAGGTITADVERLHGRWKLASQTAARVVIDGTARDLDENAPLYTSIDLVSTKQLQALAAGRHEISLDLRAWFLDPDQVEREAFGKGKRFIRFPIQPAEAELLALWQPMAGPPLKYGPARLAWDVYWRELRQRISVREIESVRLPSKAFQVVEQLPSTYPGAVKSSELDAGMNTTVRVEDVEFLRVGDGRLWAIVAVKTLGPPLAFAGSAELFDASGTSFAIMPDIAFQLGDARTRLFIEFADTSAIPATAARLLRGEKVPLRVRLVASRDQAAATQGIDLYWDGRLDFDISGQIVSRPSVMTLAFGK